MMINIEFIEWIIRMLAIPTQIINNACKKIIFSLKQDSTGCNLIEAS